MDEQHRVSVTFIFDFDPQMWRDLELAWNTSVYEYDEVILPVNKVWTPELHVTNGSVGFIPPVTSLLTSF